MPEGYGAQVHSIVLFPGLACLVQKSTTWAEKRTPGWYYKCSWKRPTVSAEIANNSLAKIRDNNQIHSWINKKFPITPTKWMTQGAIVSNWENPTAEMRQMGPGAEMKRDSTRPPLCVVCLGRGGGGWDLQRNQILPLPSVLFLWHPSTTPETNMSGGSGLKKQILFCGKLSSLQEDTPVTWGQEGLSSSAFQLSVDRKRLPTHCRWTQEGVLTERDQPGLGRACWSRMGHSERFRTPVTTETAAFCPVILPWIDELNV